LILLPTSEFGMQWIDRKLRNRAFQRYLQLLQPTLGWSGIIFSKYEFWCDTTILIVAVTKR
jgi:hypothetical protein